MPAMSAASAAASAAAPERDDRDDRGGPPKLYRSSEGRVIGGVARGLAGHLGLPVSWVRVVFVLLGAVHGLGMAVYAAFWFVVPLGVGGVGQGAGMEQAVGCRRWLRRPRPRRGQVLAALVMAGGVASLVKNLDLGAANGYVIPALLMAAGVALVWRQADNARRARWTQVSRSRRLLPVARGAAGVILVGAGVTGFLFIQGSARYLGAVLQAALAVVAGIALLAGPYIMRMMHDLSQERMMRIRAQERAEVAAHVHDSVLHTLTLIQRSADDPREVARLARAQERELRDWLYRPEGSGRGDDPATVAAAVRAAAAEVEDAHGVPVEAVCVGDCALDARLGAMMQAAREAMVNAAKYGGGAAGGPGVQVYAEVEEARVFVSVRDRGPGFDIDQVPADRMGVRESIIGRMQRNGGRAVLHAAPGGGTEVELEMGRATV